MTCMQRYGGFAPNVKNAVFKSSLQSQQLVIIIRSVVGIVLLFQVGSESFLEMGGQDLFRRLRLLSAVCSKRLRIM
jgi:hypothetical protein